MALRECFTTSAGSVTLVECGLLHDRQVFAVDVPLNGISPNESNPDVWAGSALTQWAAAFETSTGAPLDGNRFSIAAVMTSSGVPPIVACAAVSADGSQWQGSAELTGVYAGIDVGECFNFPTQDSWASEIDCDEAHEAEMFHVDAPVGIDDPLAPYPTDTEWDEIAARLCDPAFTSYTGQPVGTGTLSYTFLYTVPSGWMIPSERVLSCAVVNFDGTMINAPVRV